MNWFNQGTYEMLLDVARAAAGKSYSEHPAGAGALLLNERGHHQVASGCRIDNFSPSLSACAERVAIQTGVAAGYRKLLVLAVSHVGEDLDRRSRVPCGACWQVMVEFACPETLVVVDGLGVYRLEELVPRAIKNG